MNRTISIHVGKKQFFVLSHLNYSYIIKTSRHVKHIHKSPSQHLSDIEFLSDLVQPRAKDDPRIIKTPRDIPIQIHMDGASSSTSTSQASMV